MVKLDGKYKFHHQILMEMMTADGKQSELKLVLIAFRGTKKLINFHPMIDKPCQANLSLCAGDTYDLTMSDYSQIRVECMIK